LAPSALGGPGIKVTGFFGGTFGGTNGTKISGTLLAPAEGDVYVGYRELLANNAVARPFTCDRMFVLSRGKSGSIRNFGTVKATTKTTPRVGTNGCPTLGNASFKLTGGGLVPGPNPNLFLMGIPQNPPLDLGAVGGQPGSKLYVTPLAIFATVSDTNGDAFLPLPIPTSASLKGVQVSFQVLDLDPVLLKFGNSDGLTITIGG